MTKPRMMFYNDSRHTLAYMYEPPIQKEEWESVVDALVGTPVEALMFCLGDGRTVMHDTKVGEFLGHNVEKWDSLAVRRAHQNPKALIEEGDDPLRIICDRAHAKGLLLYPTLLVQQGIAGHRERCSNFRFENRHLELGARKDYDTGLPGAECLDFKHQEVRDERSALIEETVNNYPVDGFELQLNYQTHYFHPNEMEYGRNIMTEWVGQVYEVVKRSGLERELVIRIPGSMEGCISAGLDPCEWISQGIVDVLIGQAGRGPGDYRSLVQAAKGSGCRIHAAVESTVDSDRVGESLIEMVRAQATNYWAQGIDGIYVVSWDNLWPYDASFYEKMRELPNPDIMAPKDKFYFVPTVMGRFGNPEPQPGIPMQLPADLEVNKATTVSFTISDDLPRWDRAGRVDEVLLRVRIMNTSEIEHLSFKLNGKELPEKLLRKINQNYQMMAPRFRTGAGYWFIFRLDRDHWPRSGDNVLEVTLLDRDPAIVPQIHIRDVELETKYLMGKNFHRRFVDPDLGPPYQCSQEYGHW